MPSTKLQRAYQQTRYEVRCSETRPPITLRVDEPCAELDAWLSRRGYDCAAFITACNPRSQALAAAVNQSRMRALEEILSQSGQTWLPGTGIPEQAGWDPEPSLLVPGLDRPAACKLAEDFEQYALVYHRRGQASRLAWTAIATAD